MIIRGLYKFETVFSFLIIYFLFFYIFLHLSMQTQFHYVSWFNIHVNSIGKKNSKIDTGLLEVQ